jgi:hypothetical protein
MNAKFNLGKKSLHDEHNSNNTIEKIYYFELNGSTEGPFTLNELISKINPDTLVYKTGLDWTKAINIPEIKNLLKLDNNVKPNNVRLNNSKKLIFISFFIIISLLAYIFYFSKSSSLTDKDVAKKDTAYDSLTNLSVSIENDIINNYDDETNKNTLQDNQLTEVINYKYINVSKISSSSTMNAANNLNYNPDNVLDNNLKTWWSPKSNDKKAWIKLEFNKPNLVRSIEIHNGSHYPDYPNYGDLYFQNNRIIKIEIEYSDGSLIYAELTEIDKIQKIDVEPKETNYIIIRVVDYKTGNKWDDICISHLKII